MKDRKILFTAFAIFLLMGAAPLQAARVHGAEEAVQRHAIDHQESANLTLQGRFGPFGGSCESTQENFVRLNGEVDAPLTALRNGEELSFGAKVALVMRVRGMLRAARRAASNDCAWLGDGSALNFQVRVAQLAEMSPCAETAREMIEAANDLEEEEHEEAMREALMVLMSPTCEVPEEYGDDDEDDADDEDDDEDLEDALSEVNAENTQEEDEILEEIDELSDELTETALADPSGASLLQENEGQVETVIAGAFIAIFFGLFFLLWLPFIVGGACMLTGLGFLVFSLIGCMLYNLLRLLMGRVPGGCPMFNWLPQCPTLFAVTIRSIWGDNVRVGSGYNRAYYNNGAGYGYNNGVGYNNYGPGYVAPITTGVYYDRRRRFFGGGWRGGRGGAVRRANRRANRANRRANRANRRARRANRRARRGGRRMGRR